MVPMLPPGRNHRHGKANEEKLSINKPAVAPNNTHVKIIDEKHKKEGGMKKRIWILILVCLFTLGTSGNLWAQISIQGGKEDLLFMDIPVVVASSKRKQPLLEAASSITIVTAEDIKYSGATNLGDLLRSVAGVDVREAHASQHVIGIRGFADTAHVLVTIDGNNVFMYHANHIFLDWAPIDLEEIEWQLLTASLCCDRSA